MVMVMFFVIETRLSALDTYLGAIGANGAKLEGFCFLGLM
jgi:hypothetical protein